MRLGKRGKGSKCEMRIEGVGGSYEMSCTATLTLGR